MTIDSHLTGEEEGRARLVISKQGVAYRSLRSNRNTHENPRSSETLDGKVLESISVEAELVERNGRENERGGGGHGDGSRCA